MNPTHPIFTVSKAMRDAELDATSKLVLYALAGRANASGACWPSLSKIATDTTLSRRAVVGKLEVLRAAGWISWVKPARTNGVSNHYQIHVPPRAPAALGHDVPYGTRCTSLGHQVHSPRAPGAPEGIHEGQQEGIHPARERATGAPVPFAVSSGESGESGEEGAQAVTAAYVASFTAARGEAPTGRHNTHARRLLAALGGNVATAKARIANAFADPYWQTKVTLARIAGDPDRFASATPTTAAPNRGALVQPPAVNGASAWTPARPLNEVTE